MGEKAWASALAERLEAELNGASAGPGHKLQVRPGRKLLYANEVVRYAPNSLNAKDRSEAKYETDILVLDVAPDESWIPRVVIETKLGQVTTHDALTYSTKAWTHRHVHPYLRYGVLVGGLGSSLPPRLLRHGAHFDFMLVWPREQPTDGEFRELVDLLRCEVETSRRLGAFQARSARGERFRLLHRRLEFTRAEDPSPQNDDE